MPKPIFRKRRHTEIVWALDIACCQWKESAKGRSKLNIDMRLKRWKCRQATVWKKHLDLRADPCCKKNRINSNKSVMETRLKFRNIGEIVDKPESPTFCSENMLSEKNVIFFCESVFFEIFINCQHCPCDFPSAPLPDQTATYPTTWFCNGTFSQKTTYKKNNINSTFLSNSGKQYHMESWKM